MLKFSIFIKFLLPQFLMIHGALSGRKESFETLNSEEKTSSGNAEKEIKSLESVYLLQDSDYRTFLILHNGEKLELMQNILGDYSINNINDEARLVEKDGNNQSFVKTLDGRKVYLKKTGKTFVISRENTELLNKEAFRRYLDSLKEWDSENYQKKNLKPNPGDEVNIPGPLYLVQDSKYSTYLYLHNGEKLELVKNIVGDFSINNYNKITKMVEKDLQKRIYVKTLDGHRAYLRDNGRTFVLSAKKIELLNEEAFSRYLDSLKVRGTENNQKENPKPHKENEVNTSGPLYLVQDSKYRTFLYLHNGKKIELTINIMGKYSAVSLKNEVEIIEKDGKKQYYVRTLDGKKAYLRNNGRSFELSSKNFKLLDGESFKKYLDPLEVTDNE